MAEPDGGGARAATLPGLARGVVVAGALAVGACATTPDGGAADAARDGAASTPASAGAGPARLGPAGNAPVGGAPAGTAVSGASVADADADGVGDARDGCAGTPPGELVAPDGCALFSRVLGGVVFAPNDHRLGAASREALRGLVADLDAHPDVVLRLEGHTDNRGPAAANLELSKRRVMSVARFLVANGIAPTRLVPYGFGESRPRAGNATEVGRERNRRIEIVRLSPPPTLAEPRPTGQNAADVD